MKSFALTAEKGFEGKVIMSHCDMVSGKHLAEGGAAEEPGALYLVAWCQVGRAVATHGLFHRIPKPSPITIIIIIIITITATITIILTFDSQSPAMYHSTTEVRGSFHTSKVVCMLQHRIKR